MSHARRDGQALSQGICAEIPNRSPADDNAASESFLALLQKNVLTRKARRTRDELRTSIITWIERPLRLRRR